MHALRIAAGLCGITSGIIWLRLQQPALGVLLLAGGIGRLATLGRA